MIWWLSKMMAIFNHCPTGISLKKKVMVHFWPFFLSKRRKEKAKFLTCLPFLSPLGKWKVRRRAFPKSGTPKLRAASPQDSGPWSRQEVSCLFKSRSQQLSAINFLDKDIHSVLIPSCLILYPKNHFQW